MRTGERIDRSVFSVASRRVPIDSVYLAMSGSYGPIQQCGVPVKLGRTTFAGRGQPVHRGAFPVGGGFTTDLRRPVESVRRKPSANRRLELFAGIVPLVANLVSHIRCPAAQLP
jgi:hypothetical protein